MAANRNSYGNHNPDLINPRAEYAAERSYNGNDGMVSQSRYVGIPGKADDRMTGITSMKPLVSNGMTTAVKRSDNSDPQLNVKLNRAQGNYK
jgi:hypothetical protein